MNYKKMRSRPRNLEKHWGSLSGPGAVLWLKPQPVCIFVHVGTCQRKFSEIFRNFLKISEIFWNFLNCSEMFWNFLKNSEKFWNFLENFESLQNTINNLVERHGNYVVKHKHGHIQGSDRQTGKQTDRQTHRKLKFF